LCSKSVRGEKKNMYNDYVANETIMKDNDHWDLVKTMRLDPHSLSDFSSMIKVKFEVLTLDKANGEEVQRGRTTLLLREGCGRGTFDA